MYSTLISIFMWTLVQSGTDLDLPLPELYQVNEHQQQELKISDDAAAVFMLSGEYEGKIFLTPHVNLNTVKGQAFVAHEMMHYIQYKEGFFKHTTCAASSEPQAYKIQNQYLIEHGDTQTSSEEFVRLISHCFRVTDK